MLQTVVLYHASHLDHHNALQQYMSSHRKFYRVRQDRTEVKRGVLCADAHVCKCVMQVNQHQQVTNKFKPSNCYIVILIGVGCTNDAIPAPTQDGCCLWVMFRQAKGLTCNSAQSLVKQAAIKGAKSRFVKFCRCGRVQRRGGCCKGWRPTEWRRRCTQELIKHREAFARGN